MTQADRTTVTDENKLPVDAPLRARALCAGLSFIVQAPAGSGKTELLTRRVLTLLALVDEPEQILAITFTRKAASEMRARVISALRIAGSGACAKSEYERQGKLLAQNVLDRDQQLGWALLENPQRLNLRTIDAFSATLAYRLPVVSALGAPAEIVENATPLYHLAAARFLDSRCDALDLVLLQLGNRLEHAQALFAEMLANRDQWGRLIHHNDMRALRRILEQMLEDLIESRLRALVDVLPLTLNALLPTLLTESARVRTELAGFDPVKIKPGPAQLLNMVELPDADVGAVPAWVAIAEILLVAQSSKPAQLRKKLDRRQGFAISPGDADALGVEMTELKRRKAQMTELLESIAEEQTFIEMLAEIRCLPMGGYGDDEWALLEQLLSELPTLLAELQVIFADRGVVDFIEMSTRASRALGTDESPTDLALALDMRIQHILIDEFQDTSQTQFALFEKLLAGWVDGDGRTFFAVGDPMQSIYRFRDGDVTLFDRARDFGIANVQLESLTLSVNFRAASEIVAWTNETFADVFPTTADADVGAVPYSRSIPHLTHTGSVTVHPLTDCHAEYEAELVADLTRAAITDNPAHQVAILLRSRAQAADIFTALQQHNITYQSIDMELLGDRPVVRDVLSLCLALRYPHDRLHWLAVLRAPWCGLGLIDLHALMVGSEQRTVVELMREAARIDGLSADGRERVRKFLSVIEPALISASRSALLPWVEACWLQLGGPSVCRNAVDVDAAERCFTHLQKLEAAGQLWQSSVMHTAMQTLYAEATDSADVQVHVMTLHKAKGLEFDTVIAPALDRSSRVDQQQLLNWFESGGQDATRVYLAPIMERGVPRDKMDKINLLVRQARRRCDEQEKLRLLYVACTRAKSHLHLTARTARNTSGELKTPTKVSLLYPLWHRFKSTFEIQDTHTAPHSRFPDTHISSAPESLDSHKFKSSQLPVTPSPLRRLPIDWCLPVMASFAWPEKERTTTIRENSVKFQWAGTVARDIGNIVHQQLQRFAQFSVLTENEEMMRLPELVSRQLKNVGVSNNRLQLAIETVVRALRNTVEDERGRWILSDAHEDAHSEWAITAVIGQEVRRVVIDRTFVDVQGFRWIIDFKTGDHQGSDLDGFLRNECERYENQLIKYADIIKQFDRRPVKLGLYFPLLQAWREIEYSPYSAKHGG